jgi:hypothetical protein
MALCRLRARWRTRVLILCTSALSLGLGGCMTWRSTPLPVARVVEEQDPSVVRIRSLGGGTVTVNAPQVVSDSLVGLSRDDRVSLALVDVAEVEVRRVSGARTTFLVLGLAVAVPATVALALCGWGPCGGPS